MEKFDKERETKEVWYAHGEVSNTKSIMLGYDHYCGSLAKINDYIKNTIMKKYILITKLNLLKI